VGRGFLAAPQLGAGGTLAQLKVSGSLLGGATESQMVEILAHSIGTVQISGNVTNSRLLAGTDLGADWAVGGTGANADTFGAGTIGSVAITGSVSDSLIGAGLISHAGGFDLAWLDANDAFFAGSTISKITIGGTLTSSLGLGPYGIGAYHIVSFSIHGSTAPNPLVVSEV
jgi:hypothetical protein